MQPLISIIIPTYNRAHLLGETLESIISQTCQNWECIVIDDGSVDYTIELMEFYTALDLRIFYYKRPVGRLKGANSCRNFGFEQCQGQYINWFDDDDLMHPQKLEKQLELLGNSDLFFCVCQSTVFKGDKCDSNLVRDKNIISNNVFFDYLTMNIGWLTQAPVWKRSFLENLDLLFDEELQGAQEWEFHLRVLRKFPNYAVLEEPLVFIRKHKHSITYNKQEQDRFWHYFQARLKIYQNRNLELDKGSQLFLETYLLNAFKRMIITRNKHILKAFRKFVNRNSFGLSAKINALAAIFSFKYFGIGNIFLTKIK